MMGTTCLSPSRLSLRQSSRSTSARTPTASLSFPTAFLTWCPPSALSHFCNELRSSSIPTLSLCWSPFLLLHILIPSAAFHSFFHHMPAALPHLWKKRIRLDLVPGILLALSTQLKATVVNLTRQPWQCPLFHYSNDCGAPSTEPGLPFAHTCYACCDR